MMTAILFDAQLFERNLAALAERHAPLAQAIRDAADDPGVAIEPAKNGKPTLTLDGKRVLSQYAPENDAARAIEAETADAGASRVVLVLGFELGYVATALLAKTPAKIFVVEPRLGVLRAALGAVDLADMLRDPRVHVVDRIDQLFFQIEYRTRLEPNLGICVLPALKALYAADLEALQRRVALLLDDQTIITLTNIQKQHLWFHNLIENFPRYARRAPVSRLHRRFAGRPAVVVSAGPSLNKNAHLLPQWKDRGVIISVGTALKKCVEVGVTPDLVVALESNDILSQFAGVEQIRDAFTALLVKCHPRLWELPARGGFFVGNHTADVYWLFDLLGCSEAILTFSGSVSTAAFSLAAFMGCSPIVIVGQDLAYGETGESHAPGADTGGDFSVDRQTIAEVRAQPGSRGADFLLVEGYHGGQVVTKANLRNYLLWFEQYIPKAQAEGVRVVNATEGGAKIHGPEQLTLAEATAQFLSEPFAVGEAIAQAAQPLSVDVSAIVGTLDRTKKDLLELSRLARHGQQYAAEVFDLLNRPRRPAERIDRLIHKIGKEEKRLAALAAKLDNLLTAVAGRDLLLVKTVFDYEGLSLEESIRLNMKHTTTMYQGLLNAADMVLAEIDALIGHLHALK
jgi:hypothetical protein